MPLLSFDPEVGMVAPTSAEIRGVVADNWKNAFDRNDGSPELDTEDTTPAGQMIDSETAILAQINAELLYLFSMLNPRLAEGVWQDAIGYIYFLVRKIAQPTTVTVTCTGLPGTIIPVGAQVKDTNENRYECVSAVTIGDNSTINARFQCIEAGPIECAKNSVKNIVTVIPGWEKVNNPENGVTGFNRESQVDFENRRFESVAKNSHGAVASLQGSLWNIDGVTDCRVLENTGDDPITPDKMEITIPGHSVAICIYGGDSEEIAQKIYEKKDAGCGTLNPTFPDVANVVEMVSYQTNEPLYINATYDYYIIRPVEKSVYVKVTMHKTPLTQSDIRNRVKKAVVNDFRGHDPYSGNTKVGLASTVYASRFAVAITRTAGVHDLESIEIKLGSNGTWGPSIDINAKTEPTITVNNVIVYIPEEDDD